MRFPGGEQMKKALFIAALVALTACSSETSTSQITPTQL